ncbi:hypothetical protein [Saccharothrix sp.]|uniref:hypothetical protein n=1 Tax=Saccharothrix sp. TaxID=1873460 RepID=UPI0028122BCC|nr:hypothetical protein [Saccharothrix sp.]
MIWDRMRRKKPSEGRTPPPFDVRPLEPPADLVLVPIDLTRLPAETLAAMGLPVDGSRPVDWPGELAWPPEVLPEVLWLLDPTAPRPAKLPPEWPWPPEIPQEMLWALDSDGPPPPGWPADVPWPPEPFWPTPPPPDPPPPPPSQPWSPPPSPPSQPWSPQPPPASDARGRGPGGYIGDVRPLRRDPVPEPSAPPSPPSSSARVAWFRGDAAALALLGAVEDQSLRCHRAPDGSVCLPITDAAEQAALALGAEIGPAPDTSTWPVVTAAELAASAAVPATGPDRSEVSVLTPGLLAAPLVKSCLDSDVPVTVTAIQLRRNQEVRPAVLLRLGGQGGPALPKSLLRTTSALPDTVVCREVGPSLLVDHRARYPVDDDVLAASVPAGRRWAVTSDGSGVWDVVVTARETAPTLHLPVAAPPRHAPTPVDGVAIGIALVRDDTTADRVDATLVSDDDLPALRVFLAHGPAREALHVVPGPGRHLLVEPGGTTDPVPFGVPVARFGSDGLYLESGTALRPRPPANALVEHFGLARGTVVVATAEGAFRFRAEDAVPAWSLWLQDPPEVRDGLSATAEKLLARLAEVARPGKPEAVGAPEHEPAQRVGLISAATRLELSGDLAAAARQLELAGDFYRAARLYEQAAGE